ITQASPAANEHCGYKIGQERVGKPHARKRGILRREILAKREACDDAYMKWQVAIIIENARVYAFGFFQQRSIEHEPHHDCDARIKKEIDECPAIRFRGGSTDCLQRLVDVLVDLITRRLAFEQQSR